MVNVAGGDSHRLLGLPGVILWRGFRAFENRVLDWYYGLRRTSGGTS